MTRALSAGLLVALFGAAAGCGGVRAASQNERAQEDPWPWRGQLPTALERRIERVATNLRRSGWHPSDVWGHGFLTSGGDATERLELPEDGCVTLIAVATRGIRDLDAAIFAPSGELIAEDVQPDPHPTLQLCSHGRAKRLYYNLRAYDGTGAFAYVAFLGEADRFEDAASVLGGRPGIATMESSDATTGRRVDALVAGAARRGFRRVADPIDVRLAATQRVRVPLRVEAGHCYTVGAFPAGGVEDLNLRLLDRLDRELARDNSQARDAAVQWCSNSVASVSIEAEAVRGSGSATLIVLQGAEATVGGRSGLWLGEPAPYRSASALDEDPPDGSIVVARGVMSAGESRRVRVPPLVSGCERLELVGGRGVETFRYRLGSGPARVSPVARAVAHRCAPAEATSLDFSMRGGTGAYALWRRSSEEIEGIPRSLRGAALDACAEAESLGLVRRALTQVGREGFRRSGDGCFVAKLLGQPPGGGSHWRVTFRSVTEQTASASDSGEIVGCGSGQLFAEPPGAWALVFERPSGG